MASVDGLDAYVKDAVSKWKDDFDCGIGGKSIEKIVEGVVDVVTNRVEADAAVEILYGKFDRGYKDFPLTGYHSHDVGGLDKGASDRECLALAGDTRALYEALENKGALGETAKESFLDRYGNKKSD